jgi:acetylornithine deacetylase/succinyl-diaminopimelate desuccinylase-like protein
LTDYTDQENAMPSVNEYIDDHFEETVEKLKKWCAQPSISTEGLGVGEMAELAASSLAESGFEVRTFPTAGYPVILGETGPMGGPTILIYNHYDVQPVGDLAEWSSPPFEPQVRHGFMYGRGVADTKSNIVARLDALNAVRAVRGDLPVRVVWLLEGEEEIGSPHLDQFIAEHREDLKADGCIWEFGNYTWDGTPNIYLGLKGMLSVELTARTASRDLHSANAAFVPSPVWRLVWALSTIKTPDDRVHIPGFYDSITVPNDEQLRMSNSIPDETQELRETMGIPAFINDMQGPEVYRASSFSPTANILGIEAGYNGPGSKTVLPKEARAKLDIRLVPDQDPEAIFQSLTTFLKEKGFDDVEVSRIANEGDLLPAVSDPAAPFIQKVIQACREVSGRQPVVTPSSAGSGPMAPFTQAPPKGLGVPTAAFGTGYPDTRAHGPDENIRLSDMRAHMYTVARLVEIMG